MGESEVMRLTQFSRFLAAGAIGTVGHYALLIATVSVLGLAPVIGATMGASLGALTNYVLNYRYTFISNVKHVVALPRFLLLAGVGIFLNAFIVGALVYFGFHYLAAQVVATAGVLVLNYFVSKTWIFREPRV